MEPTLLHALARFVLGADWIVRAQGTHPQRLGEVVFEVSRLLDQTTERPLGVRAPSIQQNPVSLGFTIGVDPFADGAGRIKETRINSFACWTRS